MIKYNLIEGKNQKTEKPIFYAMPAPVNVVKLPQLADEISKECTVTPHDVRAVISAMEQHIITHLQNGDSVRLGLIGSFRPTLRSEATESPLDFTNKNILSIGVAFTQSSTMRYQLSASNPNVSFERLNKTA